MTTQNFNDIVILFCPSKVGSTSIASSIRFCAADKYFIFHTHTNKILDVITGGLQGNITVETILNNTYNPLTGKKRNIFLIDIYRPTIEKRISEFFQDISSKHFHNHEENINEYNLERIIKRFNDIYPHIEHIDYYRDWYNLPQEELLKPFDMEKKYIKYKLDNITYIKLRLCDFNEWKNILSNELEINLHMIPDYKSKDKKIGKLYQKFNESYKLPYNFFRMIELCPQFNYYYTESEKQSYLDKWRNKITDSYVSFNKNEYELYVKISEENQIFKKNLNNHYRDSGCMCEICKTNRSNQFDQLELGILSTDNINVVHMYDNNYNSTVSIYVNDSVVTVNVVNY